MEVILTYDIETIPQIKLSLIQEEELEKRLKRHIKYNSLTEATDIDSARSMLMGTNPFFGEVVVIGLRMDKPETGDDYSPPSRYASFDSFGHRGFTGTIAWADPTFNLVFVFLSNRIYPDIDNSKLIDFNIRKRINDVVYESMWSFEKQFN